MAADVERPFPAVNPQISDSTDYVLREKGLLS
jgi:hypothetical protein